MKAIVVVLALVASAFALVNPIYKEWNEWKLKYQPKYISNEEEEKRIKIFAQNRRRVLELNKLNANEPDGARFALNQFADLTPEEFAARYLHEIPHDFPRPAYLPPTKKTLKDYPEEKNWVEDGAVTEVKNQGNCSSLATAAATVVSCPML
jgi:C1A family cysteine protease